MTAAIQTTQGRIPYHPISSVKILVRALLLVLGLIVPLGVAEGYLRVARPIPRSNLLPYPYQYQDLQRIIDGNAYVTFDQELGWTPTPGATRRQDGVSYAANRVGLRAERDYADLPPNGIRRISAFGDSYTYCENVELRDCWTSQLELRLPNTEILNYGVPAYGPDQAWLRYQRDGISNGSCGVLIGYMTENINRVVNRFRPFYKPPDGFVLSKPRFLLEGDGLRLLPSPVTDIRQLQDPVWAEAALGPDDRWYFPGVFVPNPLDVLDTVRVTRTALYRYRREGEIDFHSDLARQTERPYRTQAEAYQVAGRVLIGFSKQVQQTGAAPLVVIFGQRTDIETAMDRAPKAHQPLLDWLDREGIAYVDVTDDLARASQGSRGSSSRNVIANHYRPFGNEVVARTLLREMPRAFGSSCSGLGAA